MSRAVFPLLTALDAKHESISYNCSCKMACALFVLDINDARIGVLQKKLRNIRAVLCDCDVERSDALSDAND
jgi:hypothetical protein